MLEGAQIASQLLLFGFLLRCFYKISVYMFSPENKCVFCPTKITEKKKKRKKKPQQLNESSPKCGEENEATQRFSSPRSSLPHRVPASAGCLSVGAGKRRRSGLGVLAAVGGWRRGRGAGRRGGRGQLTSGHMSACDWSAHPHLVRSRTSCLYRWGPG